MADVDEQLSAILAPHIAEVIEIVKAGKLIVTLPDSNTADLPMDELSSLVARASNIYGQAARFAGMARAEVKLAKGRYERKYKRYRVGKNDAERDQAGIDKSLDEHKALSVAEAIAELAGSLEDAARVASESIRKIHTGADAQHRAYNRELKGSYKDSDFN